jgi:hypothetical protein
MTMSIGKVVRNAGSHRILYALSMGSKGSKELKLIVGAINSINRFDGEYMSRLVTSGYVRRVPQGWVITRLGVTKLKELGPVAGFKPEPKGIEKSKMTLPSYVPERDNRTLPIRPGSEDFLRYPSRIGMWLCYRDGRRERIN